MIIALKGYRSRILRQSLFSRVQTDRTSLRYESNQKINGK